MDALDPILLTGDKDCASLIPPWRSFRRTPMLLEGDK